MPTNSIRAAKPGPITLSGKAPGMSIAVTIDDTLDYAEVEVSTNDTSGAAADVVNEATLRHTADGIYVEIDQVNVTMVNGQVFVTRGNAGMTIVGGGGGVVIGGGSFSSIVGGVVSVGDGNIVVSGGRNVSIGRGMTQINDFSGNSVNVGGTTSSSGIRITARLPKGSSIDFVGGVNAGPGELNSVKVKGNNASVNLPGTTRDVDVEARNGDIAIGTADEIEASSHNGNVSVDRVTGRANLDSHNGNVTVFGVTGVKVRAGSHNGNVTYGSNLDVRPRSHNGRVNPIRIPQ